MIDDAGIRVSNVANADEYSGCSPDETGIVGERSGTEHGCETVTGRLHRERAAGE
jgi:hypothetical protein